MSEMKTEHIMESEVKKQRKQVCFLKQKFLRNELFYK